MKPLKEIVLELVAKVAILNMRVDQLEKESAKDKEVIFNAVAEVAHQHVRINQLKRKNESNTQSEGKR